MHAPSRRQRRARKWYSGVADNSRPAEDSGPGRPELCLVREGGLEPPRPFGHWHLKPARLPFRHSRSVRTPRQREPAEKASTSARAARHVRSGRQPRRRVGRARPGPRSEPGYDRGWLSRREEGHGDLRTLREEGRGRRQRRRSRAPSRATCSRSRSPRGCSASWTPRPSSCPATSGWCPTTSPSGCPRTTTTSSPPTPDAHHRAGRRAAHHAAEMGYVFNGPIRSTSRSPRPADRPLHRRVGGRRRRRGRDARRLRARPTPRIRAAGPTPAGARGQRHPARAAPRPAWSSAAAPRPTCGSTTRASRGGTPRSGSTAAAPPLQIDIVDLGSTNGITVNGHKVREAALQEGSRIEIGSTRMLVHAPPDDDPCPRSR